MIEYGRRIYDIVRYLPFIGFLTPETLVHAYSLHHFFIPTPGTLVKSPCHELLPFTPRTLIYTRTLHLFVPTTRTFVRVCATPLYCTPPSALIPLNNLPLMCESITTLLQVYFRILHIYAR
jgi:hypothetical protein